MPQPFKKAVVTDAGIALMAAAQMVNAKVEFTKVVIGNGVYSAEEKTDEYLQAQTSLKSQKNTFGISDASIISEHLIKVTALLTNADPVTNAPIITEGYYINEIGVYAKIGDQAEVLYSIAVTDSDSGDFMPSNDYPSQIIQDFYISVENAENVKIKVVMSPGQPYIKPITISKDAWEDDGTGFHVDVSVPIASEDLFPIASIASGSKDTAQTAGLWNEVESIDGAVRFWADQQPKSDINAIVVLYEDRSKEGTDYVLPIADEDTLGGVMLGTGIEGTEDGTISAHANPEDIADDAEVSAMIKEIFGL